jgi:bacillithiol biosynthesis deacetylase BshB1
MKLDVLVFAAHPDDAELNAGGTIASLISEGKRVGILDLTKGEMGTRGTAESRQNEVNAASNILGIHYRVNLDLGDSIIDNSRVNQLKLIEQIRHTQPDICLVGASYDRHPDHGKATQLSIDSIFYSGLIKLKTTINGTEQEAWRPSTIFQYTQDRPFEPDFIFDISDYWETKKKAILAYDSQFNVTEKGNEPETYISSSKYFAQIEARTRYFGHLAGFEMGEPFKKIHGPIGVKSFENLF